MTQRILMLSPRDSDAATMTASSSISAALGVANLQDMQPGKKWRSSGTSGEYVLVTFASAVAVNCLALIAHNLSGAATIRLRGAVLQANLTSSPDYDSGAVNAFPGASKPTDGAWPVFTSLIKSSNTTACRYWRLDFTDGTPVTTYLEAGRLILGVAWQPSIDFDYGGTPLGFDTSGDVQSKTRYGRTFTSQSAESPPRLFQLSHYALTQTDALAGLADIQRTRGQWGDVVCCLDADATTHFHRFTVHGLFTDSPAYTLPPQFQNGANMFGAAIKLRELL